MFAAGSARADHLRRSDWPAASRRCNVHASHGHPEPEDACVRRPPFAHSTRRFPRLLSAQALAPHQQLAHDIYKELIEINTADSVGNTTTAANAVAKRLLAAGFSEGDIFQGGPQAGQRQPRRPLPRLRRTQAASACSRTSTSCRRSRPIGRRTSIRSSSPSATATTTAAARATTRRWGRSSSPTSFATSRRAIGPIATSSSRSPRTKRAAGRTVCVG